MQKLSHALIEKGLVSADRIEQAEEMALRDGEPLFAVLLREGWVSEAPLLRVLAQQYGLSFVVLSESGVDASAVQSVPAKLAAHYGVMPFRLLSGVLTLAVADPLDMGAVEDIEANLGYRVERVLACRSEIRDALHRHYGVGAATVERILADSPSEESPVLPGESDDLERMAQDASVVHLVNQLLQEAIKNRATDVHLEAYRDEVTARRRVDGVLYETPVPKNMRLLYPAIVSRIKVMSGLDIVERRLPQDGRARVRIGGREYDLRISVVPSVHGEDIVIRILPAAMLFDLAHLGLSPDHLSALEALIRQPHGILFLTGPTGSGKTTTLYACLNRLNTRDRKIITIEDPVEYELKGMTQTQVNPKIGLTFGRALRSMLRHDPDVMMVGEVRDRETAEIAVQTAMTGHLVFSTLHTNDAASGAIRLLDMGVEPYLIGSTVLCFIAQRLVRVICADCRERFDVEGQTLYRGRGCRQCDNLGYHGRQAICEFLPLTGEIQRLILARASAQEIRRQADELGMKTLAQDGWEKVLSGVTTRDEVMRVTAM